MKILSDVKRDWLALCLLLGPSLLAVILWNDLPEQVASHWNVAGEVNGWMSKTIFVTVMTGFSVSLYLLLLIVPHIDPKGSLERLRQPVKVIRLAMVGLLAITTSAVLLFNTGVPVDIVMICKVGVPILLLIVGNLFGKLSANYFVGIRTPWTLESKEVWVKTHRLAGGVWVASALFLLLCAFILSNPQYVVMLFVAVAVMVIILIVYSYVIFKRQTA